MIYLITLFVSPAFATPSCDEIMSILAMEMCEDVTVPACIDAHARYDAGVCDEQMVAMLDAAPEEPAPVASAPVQATPVLVVQPIPPPAQTVSAPPPQPPVPPPDPVSPVTASITLTVVPAAEQSMQPAYLNPVQAWSYVLPGYSQPPVAADPAEQWEVYGEEQQWKAIHTTDQKASAALVATDNLYTTLFPSGGSQ